MRKSFDKHLNIFMTYGDDCKKENNITKAFINMLMYSDEKKFNKIEFLKKLIGDKGSILKESDYIEYDLQNPIDKKHIKDSKAEKILLGLSPYGKEEGIEYFDIVLEQLNSKNIKKIEKNEWDDIYNKIKEKNKRKIEKEIDKRFEQIKENNEIKENNDNEIKEKNKIENKIKKELEEEINKEFRRFFERGGSIPDAWIYIYNNKEKENLKLIIAIENKLWKLDKSQLLNHMEKSLGKKKEEEIIIYKSFEKLILELDEQNKDDNLVINFIRYMEMLGYNVIEKFKKEDIEYTKQNINEKSKEQDMTILTKKWNKLFEEYKKENENNEKFEFDRKNMINIKKLEKDKEKKMLNLTYGMAPFNKEENAIFTALEICVSSGKPEILKRLIERIQSKENLIELFNIESDNKFKLSYDIYRKTTRHQTSKYYEIKNGDNIYKTVEKCVNKLIEMSKNNELLKKDLSYDNFKKIVAVEKDIEEEEVKNNIRITGWKKSIDFNLQTYLRFIEYIPYSEIINDNIEESAEEQKERIFKILDEAIENQIKKAKEIEKELLK